MDTSPSSCLAIEFVNWDDSLGTELIENAEVPCWFDNIGEDDNLRCIIYLGSDIGAGRSNPKIMMLGHAAIFSGTKISIYIA